MFTGIIEELGRTRSVDEVSEGVRLQIEAADVLTDLAVGGSVAVNGVCLTAIDVGAESFRTHVISETLAKSCLGDLHPGEPVNLERPVRVGGRFDGHMVQGHVDGVGEIVRREASDDGSFTLEISAPDAVLRYVVGKGSIAVDGVSLTVADLRSDGFVVALIPHTAEVTTLGHKSEGAPVNLEVDMVAKYVERLLAAHR